MGKWKIPSLMDLAFTPPYMRGGLFATPEEVLDFLESGGHFTATLDPLIRDPDNPNAGFPGQKGLGFTEAERKDLLAFRSALNDSSFTTVSSPRNPPASAPPRGP